jgi:hypothetical protein
MLQAPVAAAAPRFHAAAPAVPSAHHAPPAAAAPAAAAAAPRNEAAHVPDIVENVRQDEHGNLFTRSYRRGRFLGKVRTRARARMRERRDTRL